MGFNNNIPTNTNIAKEFFKMHQYQLLNCEGSVTKRT